MPITEPRGRAVPHEQELLVASGRLVIRPAGRRTPRAAGRLGARLVRVPTNTLLTVAVVVFALS
jgi:hypothetical protein